MAQIVRWEDGDGNVLQVPPHVREALVAPWRGQSRVGKKQKAVLAFYHDQPVLLCSHGKSAAELFCNYYYL